MRKGFFFIVENTLLMMYFIDGTSFVSPKSKPHILYMTFMQQLWPEISFSFSFSIFGNYVLMSYNQRNYLSELNNTSYHVQKQLPFPGDIRHNISYKHLKEAKVTALYNIIGLMTLSSSKNVLTFVHLRRESNKISVL